jgi:hypothetical protein
MAIPEKHWAWLLAASALLAACGDQPPPLEPLQRSTATVPTTSTVGNAAASLASAQAIELSPGVRAAMTKTLSSALAELDLPSEAPMSTLQDFFRQLDVQQAERRTRHVTLPQTSPQ